MSFNLANFSTSRSFFTQIDRNECLYFSQDSMQAISESGYFPSYFSLDDKACIANDLIRVVSSSDELCYVFMIKNTSPIELSIPDIGNTVFEDVQTSGAATSNFKIFFHKEENLNRSLLFGFPSDVSLTIQKNGLLSLVNFSFPNGFQKFSSTLYFFLECVLSGELLQIPLLIDENNNVLIDKTFNQGQILTIKKQIFFYQGGI